MDWGTVAQWVSAGSSAAALVFAINAQRIARSSTRFGGFEQKLDKAFGAIENITVRTGALEHELKHVPTVQKINEMAISIEGVKGQLNVIIERVTPLRAMSDRFQEAMIEFRKAG